MSSTARILRSSDPANSYPAGGSLPSSSLLSSSPTSSATSTLEVISYRTEEGVITALQAQAVEKGFGASPGFAVASAFKVIRRSELLTNQHPTSSPSQAGVSETVVPEAERPAQLSRLIEAIGQVHANISATERQQKNDDLKKILRVHAGLIKDRAIHQALNNKVMAAGATAEHAVVAIFDQFIAQMSGNKFLVSKAGDLRELQGRLLAELTGVNYSLDLSALTEPVVLVVDELLPMESIALDPSKVAAVVTHGLGPNDHVVVACKEHDIPCVSLSPEALHKISHSEVLAIFASDGLVCIGSAPETLRFCKSRQEQFQSEIPVSACSDGKVILAVSTSKNTTTQSQEEISPNEISLRATITSITSADQARKRGLKHIGLYRTEFLPGHHIPFDETAMTEHFRSIAGIMHGGEVTLRCPDFGADKIPAGILVDEKGLPLPLGANPMLGPRGFKLLTLTPGSKDILRAFLRASLAVSHENKIRLLIPQVNDASEIDEFRGYLEQEMRHLEQQGIPFDPNPHICAMIETPSAVMQIESILSVVSSVSIGLNDLTAYTLATDRSQSLSGHNYTPHHPAIARMILMTTAAGRAAGKEVCMCGEAAGDPRFFQFNIGLGLRILSLSPEKAPKLATIAKHTTLEECEELGQKVLRARSAHESLDLISAAFGIVKHRIKESSKR